MKYPAWTIFGEWISPGPARAGSHPKALRCCYERVYCCPCLSGNCRRPPESRWQVAEKTMTVILRPSGLGWAEESAFVFNIGSYKQILRFARDDRINAFFSVTC